MRFSKKIAAAFAAIIVGVVAGGVLIASPAQASQDQCFSNSIACFWQDRDYQQGFYYEVQLTEGYCYNLGAGFNDLTSSVVNKTGGWLQLFQDSNCTASNSNKRMTIQDWTAVPYVGWTFNDEMTSFRKCYTPYGCGWQ